jgi:hypothetical protein
MDMALYYHNLDDRTRRLMLDEVEHDIANDCLHISPFLSGQGQRDYVNLLKRAILAGNDASFEDELNARRRINRALPRRNPKGGYRIAAVPENAAQILAEGEFNRFYIRALARRAIEDGIPALIVFRAKNVSVPRIESEVLVETALQPEELLADLRGHPDEPPSLGVPGGPNSGISVRLP